MEKEEFKQHINKLRKENKSRWYFWVGEVNSQRVQIKGFNTWLQIFNIDGINMPCPMGLSVSKFNEVLDRI